MADMRVLLRSRKPTEPGLTMTGMAVLRHTGTARQARVIMRWFDDGGDPISDTNGVLADDTAGGLLYRIVAAAPAGAVECSLLAEWLGIVGGEAHHVDEAGIFPGDVAVWSPGGFSLTSAGLYVERRLLTPDGVPATEWEAVRGHSRTAPMEPANPALPAVVLSDREVPPNRRAEYRAFLLLDDVVSDPSATVEATITNPKWRLRDPLDPSRNVAIDAKPGWAPSHKVTAGVFYIDGRENAVVGQGSIFGIASNLVLWALDEQTRDDVLVMLKSRRTLLVQSHLGEQWYVRVVGDIPTPLLRLAPVAGEPYPTRHAHEITAPLVQVDRPADTTA